MSPLANKIRRTMLHAFSKLSMARVDIVGSIIMMASGFRINRCGGRTARQISALSEFLLWGRRYGKYGDFILLSYPALVCINILIREYLYDSNMYLVALFLSG